MNKTKYEIHYTKKFKKQYKKIVKQNKDLKKWAKILNMTDEIKELVVKDASTMEIRNKAIEQGYRPLVIDGFKKVLDGYTTLAELNRKLIIY